MKEVHFSAAAERDLEQIWQYLKDESGNPELADRYIDRLITRLTVLSHTPKIGRKRDLIEMGLRALPIGKYIVYYREHERSVLVARVIHGSREQSAAFFEGAGYSSL